MISSLRNPKVAAAARLKKRALRERDRAFLVEGAQAVGEALGVKFGVDVETRIGWAADVGEHKSSMLQDLESGKAMEIDALLNAVVEMGDMTKIETPMLDAILALAVQRARNAGCYPA